MLICFHRKIISQIFTRVCFVPSPLHCMFGFELPDSGKRCMEVRLRDGQLPFGLDGTPPTPAVDVRGHLANSHF